MTVFLIRHGEITQFSPRRFVGQTDLPLTGRGREQMALVAQSLVGMGVTRLLCSPLSRCVESATIVGAALDLQPETATDLREISLGAWEGLTEDEVQERFPGSHEARGRDLAGFRPAGGESFSELQSRAWTAFEAATANTSQPMAIVAHGGVNRTLLCRILGMPLAHLFRLGQDYACMNAIRTGPTGQCVELLNCTPSLLPLLLTR